jgi:hypothetical protein
MVTGSNPNGHMKKILITSILCTWRACFLFMDSILVYDKNSYQNQCGINSYPFIMRLKHKLSYDSPSSADNPRMHNPID